MKFVYLTSKNFPGLTADHAYIEALARSFSRTLKEDFVLVGNDIEKGVMGVPTHEMRIPAFFKKSISSFFLFPSLYRTWKVHNEELVIFSNDQYLLIIAIVWRILLRRDFLVVSDWHMLSRTWRDSWIARRSDLLITTSLKLAGLLVPLTDKPIRTVYGGVDAESFRLIDAAKAREQLHLPSDKLIVAYVGLFQTLGMSNGIDTMIRSLKYLPQSVCMLFVGGKPHEISLYEDLAKLEGVSEQVIFRQRVPLTDVYAYEKASDVLVIPYPDMPHFREYGFPMKVYEYMAAGKPIIYSRLDLVEEVIGSTGVGFTPGDSKSFADAVVELQANKQKAEESTRAHEELAHKYTWDAKAQKILFEIQSIR